MIRRGGILLEMLLSLALLAGAAAFVLSALRNSTETLTRAAQRLEAMDEATSIIAQLESGLINVNDLREGSSLTRSNAHWIPRITTGPTPYQGLTLVEIEVRDRENPDRIVAQLRQLVRLRPNRDESSVTDES